MAHEIESIWTKTRLKAEEIINLSKDILIILYSKYLDEMHLMGEFSILLLDNGFSVNQELFLVKYTKKDISNAIITLKNKGYMLSLNENNSISIQITRFGIETAEQLLNVNFIGQ